MVEESPVIKELRSIDPDHMTPMEALQSATQTAAAAIEMDQQLGTLEKGKFAAAGSPQMTFVGTEKFWVQAEFTENNLAHIHPGLKVEMVYFHLVCNNSSRFSINFVKLFKKGGNKIPPFFFNEIKA